MLKVICSPAYCAVAAVVLWALCASLSGGQPPEPAKPPEIVAGSIADLGEAIAAEQEPMLTGIPWPWAFDWKKVPPVRLAARPSNFPIPPTGPGYYSLLDVALGNFREKPPRFPYAPFALMQPPFYDADFRYLDDPKNTQHDLFDPLHRIHVGDNFLFSTGGEARLRYMRELDSRLSGKDNDYELFRTRVFGDLWYKDRLRLYVEFISAQIFNEELPPLAIDGVRVFRQGEKFDVDVFWLQPIKIDATKLDSHDNNQNVAGAWFTYRPEKGTSVDLYYLFLDNANQVTTAVGPAAFALTTAPFNVHTLGTRCTGDINNI